MRCEKVRPVNEINGSHSAGGQNFDAGGNSAPQEIASQASLFDGFYEKLSKSFESSGLSLLFNFRETSLDLYMFYKEVTERGGFHVVTKDGKWGEVASTLNCKSSISMSPTQLHKLYAQLLYQFELTYNYRTLAKVVVPSGPKLATQKPDVQTSPKNNEMKKDPNAPIGSRSTYQMYLRKECD
ncbi:high mobility group B protein 10-like [Actinidia eriantha]|uniref:high mobility group B protein 10-like n=1 Tax=Actinidia eriantha TaxID=165200 RepID=UPI002584854B|nr:high mobility group B protein 10-like [Actinidia eriantha]